MCESSVLWEFTFLDIGVCASQLSVGSDRRPELNNFKKERFIFAHGFRR